MTKKPLAPVQGVQAGTLKAVLEGALNEEENRRRKEGVRASSFEIFLSRMFNELSKQNFFCFVFGEGGEGRVLNKDFC